jgi:hypothetical protein
MEDKQTNKYTLARLKEDISDGFRGVFFIGFWVIIFTQSCQEIKSKAAEPKALFRFLDQQERLS